MARRAAWGGGATTRAAAWAALALGLAACADAEPAATRRPAPAVAAAAGPQLSDAPPRAASAQDPLPRFAVDDEGAVVWPADLAGPWLFGFARGDSLGQYDLTLALPVALELAGDVLVVREVDGATGVPVPGPDGVIEGWAAAPAGGGRVRIDLSAPLAPEALGLGDACRMWAQKFYLDGAPEAEAGLLVWAAVELRGPVGASCRGPGHGGFGVSVRFLRHGRRGPGYAPRALDREAPFRFFEVPAPGADEDGGAAWIVRRPELTRGETITWTVSEADDPIVREAFAEAVSLWNDALEPVVGGRPLRVAEVAPPLPPPGDPRSHVLLVDGRPTSEPGGVAPFMASALDGEMIQADIVLFVGDLGPYVDEWLAWRDGDLLALRRQLPLEPLGRHGAAPDPRRRPRGSVPRAPAARRDVTGADIALAAAAVDDPDDADAIERAVLVSLCLHELGHTLGLRHNFAGSGDLEVAGAALPSTTVMDYVPGMDRLGDYDHDALRAAYGDGAPGAAWLACTDEDVPTDPICVRWDWGSPLAGVLARLDSEADLALAGGDVPGYPALAYGLELDTWRARALVDSPWEAWAPDRPLPAFEALLHRMTCGPPCRVHPFVRAMAALYLLAESRPDRTLGSWYLKERPYGEAPEPLPPLDATRRARLLGALFELLTADEPPLPMGVWVPAFLPRCGLPGARRLLDDLADWYAGRDGLTDAQRAVARAVLEAAASAPP